MTDHQYVLYPSHFEPVPPPIPKGAEETAWFVQASEPVRAVPRSLAAVAPAFFFVAGAIVPIDFVGAPSQETLVLQQTIVYQAKAESPFPLPDPDPFDWFVQASEPVRVVPETVDEGGAVEGVDPEPFSTDILTRWWQPASEPVRTLPRLVDEGLYARAPPDPETLRPPLPVAVVVADLSFDRTIVYQAKAEPLEPIPDEPATDWFQPPSEPVRVPPETVAEGAFTQNVEPISKLDLDWFVQPSEPVRETPPRRAGPSAFGPDPEDFPEQDLLTRWWRPAEEPVRVAPRLVDEGLLARNLDPISKLDLDWFVQASEPVRTLPRLVDEGLLVRHVEPIIPSLDFFLQPSEPVRQVPRLVDEGTVVRNVEPISKLDFDWWVPASEPVRTTPPLRPDPDATQVEILPAEPVPPFDWWVPASEPADPVPRLVDEGGLVRNLDPISKLDFDWWVPASEPVRLTPETVDEGGEAPRNLAPISKLDHDWWRPASEPVRETPRLVDEGLLVRHVVPIVPALDWFRLAEEPVRTIAPLRTEPDATQVEILPAVVDFVPVQLPGPAHPPGVLPTQPVRVDVVAPLLPLDWLVQGPGPVRPIPAVLEQLGAFGQPTVRLPIFEWWALPAIPVLPLANFAVLFANPIQVEELPPSLIPRLPPRFPVFVDGVICEVDWGRFVMQTFDADGRVDELAPPVSSGGERLQPPPPPSSGGADDPDAPATAEPGTTKSREWNQPPPGSFSDC